MDNRDIYEKAKSEAFNHIKQVRTKYASRDELTDPTMKAAFNSLMFEVEGNEYRGYSFIIEEAKNYTLKMVADIIAGLLNRYNVNYQSIDFRRLGISPTPVFAFVHIRNEGNAFYIIKEFGMNNSIDTSTLRELTKRMNARYAYVSLARENAFAEVFDYNDNADDPTRGTGIISLPFFLQIMFGEEEKNAFIRFADTYVDQVKSYLGLAVMKMLTPNALFSFKRAANYETLHYEYQKKYDELLKTEHFATAIKEIREEEARKTKQKRFFQPKSGDPVTRDQWRIIEEQFHEQLCNKALTGINDFSQTFMTAEWLYDSMRKAGKIDYSPVAMGYFKSIEQMIWDILLLYKDEQKSVSVKKNGEYSFLPINDPGIKWEENGNSKQLDTTIGSLMNALDFHRNRFIFRQEVDDDTIDAIVIVVRIFKNLRNGYTHKDNISDWNFIELVRSVSYTLYFLLLGSINLTDAFKKKLGIPLDNDTPYLRLCDYINYNSNRPYYLYDANGQCTVVLAVPDAGMEIDDDGNATYSGVYFKKVLNVTEEPYVLTKEILFDSMKRSVPLVGEVFCIEKKDVPRKIYRGTMSPVAAGMWYSGPQQLVFDNGVFIDPGMPEKPEY